MRPTNIKSNFANLETLLEKVVNGEISVEVYRAAITHANALVNANVKEHSTAIDRMNIEKYNAATKSTITVRNVESKNFD